MANPERLKLINWLPILLVVALVPLPFFYVPAFYSHLLPISWDASRSFLYHYLWFEGWELAEWLVPWSSEDRPLFFGLDSIQRHIYFAVPFFGTMTLFLRLCLLALLGHAVVWSLKPFR